jgi:predicted nucleotidyltransferase
MLKNEKILKEFKSQVKTLYGNRLKEIILYGSWARGEATEHSDIDLIVVLEDSVEPGKEIDRMIDIITDINLRYNTLLSVYPVSHEDYITLNSPLLMNARREGVPA